MNQYVMGSVSGPLTDTLKARLTAYYNNDDGPFENDFTGNDFGAIEQTMIRPTISWMPTDRLNFELMYEYTDTDGDGAAAQSHTNGSGIPGTPVNYDRDDFSFSIDDEGFQATETNLVTFETNIDVDFGGGTITNIFGYRDYDGISESDIDAQPGCTISPTTSSTTNAAIYSALSPVVLHLR